MFVGEIFLINFQTKRRFFLLIFSIFVPLLFSAPIFSWCRVERKSAIEFYEVQRFFIFAWQKSRRKQNKSSSDRSKTSTETWGEWKINYEALSWNYKVWRQRHSGASYSVKRECLENRGRDFLKRKLITLKTLLVCNKKKKGKTKFPISVDSWTAIFVDLSFSNSCFVRFHCRMVKGDITNCYQLERFLRSFSRLAFCERPGTFLCSFSSHDSAGNGQGHHAQTLSEQQWPQL